MIDHTNARILDIFEDRTKQSVIARLQELKEIKLLDKLEEVTCDMWGPYTDAVREMFGQDMRIVIDRFHVQKNFNEALSKARRILQCELAKDIAAQIKGLRWTVLKNLENLTEEEEQLLERAREVWPDLDKLLFARDRLREIFEDRSIRTAMDGQEKLEQWIAETECLGLGKPIEKFIATMRNWMPLIANYFTARSSNGRTEGFNTRIRTVLKRSFGFRNFRHLRLRVLDLLGVARYKFQRI